jgi:hypothetical protein
MVDVGSMEITATINSDEFEAGVNRVKGGLSEIESRAESGSASFGNLATTAKSLAGTLVTIGTAGVGALAGLASKAPAVAPELAKIEQSMREITFSLGERFKPFFGEVANDLQNVSGALQGNLSSIQNLIPTGSMTALGAAAGFAAFGPPGLFVGAALGYAASKAVIPQTTEAQQNRFGVFAETAESFNQQVSASQDRSILQNIGAAATGQNLREAGKTGINAVLDLFQWIYGQINEKDVTMQVEGGDRP